MRLNKTKGFTLIEIAVVLVIVGVLVGSFIGSITNRVETTRRSDTAKQLNEIKDAILGHAMAEGRIPCPTTNTGGGQEQPVGGGVCTVQHGFVPGRTLGMKGNYNLDGLLTDSWGNPIRYSVASATGGAYDATTAGGIAARTMAVYTPALRICTLVSAVANDCANATETLINETPFIIISLGKDGNEFIDVVNNATDQGENAGEVVLVANAAGENIAYTVAGDRAFVSKAYSDEESAAGQFDDIVVWVSKYVLYSRMMEAGQLP